jgi:F-type H+-transporting ATPase subunit gamma
MIKLIDIINLKPTQIVQTEQFLPLAAVQSDLTTSVGDYILNRPKKRLS